MAAAVQQRDHLIALVQLVLSSQAVKHDDVGEHHFGVMVYIREMISLLHDYLCRAWDLRASHSLFGTVTPVRPWMEC